MSVMTGPEIWPGLDRVLTVSDMENMPDDEFRYELDDGVLIVSPAPSTPHQVVVGNFQMLLGAARPAGLIVVPGVGINITRYQHRVPDLAVIDADAAGAQYQEKPPRLVIEVASPRTRIYDRNRKKDVYESFGIPAYWIFEPDVDQPQLIVFELRDGAYAQVADVTGDDAYDAELPFPVTIRPSDLVRLD